MPVTVQTFTGTTVSPTQYSFQRKIDRTQKNGVLWMTLLNNASNRIEFWFSTNNGTSWAEYTTRRISGNIKMEAGCDMAIITHPNGEERIAVAYVQDNYVRVSLGRFNSGRQTFSWHSLGKNISTAHTTWRYPQIQAAYSTGSNWYVHPVWQLHESGPGKVSVYISRIRYYDTDGASRLEQAVIHSFDGSTFSRAAWGFRHSGDDDRITINQPDNYLTWYRMNGTNRTFQQKFTYTGSGWRAETRRIVDNTASVLNGLITSCVNGKDYITAKVPHDSTSDIDLHFMSLNDTTWTPLRLPPLGKGTINNLDMSWDSFTGDLWIIASGTTDSRPNLIKYIYATSTFTAWSQINTEAMQANSMSMKPGSRANRIEFSYSITSSTNSVTKYELAGLTNVAPSQPIVHTTTGPYDRDLPLTYSWTHIDTDGDPQAKFSIRRTNAAGTGYEYWTGIAWQTNYLALTGSTQSVTFPSGWQADEETREYQTQTQDPQGLVSPWSNPTRLTGSVKVNPSITSPTASQVFTSPKIPTAWTVTEQLAFKWDVLDVSDNQLYTTNWINEVGTRSLDHIIINEGEFTFQNATTYKVRLQTMNNEGLISTSVVRTISTNFTPPAIPTLSVTTNTNARAFSLTIGNTNPGGLVPNTVSNSIYRSFDNGITWERIATGVEFGATYVYYPRHNEETDFFVQAVSVDGATRDSAAT